MEHSEEWRRFEAASESLEATIAELEDATYDFRQSVQKARTRKDFAKMAESFAEEVRRAYADAKDAADYMYARAESLNAEFSNAEEAEARGGYNVLPDLSAVNYADLLELRQIVGEWLVSKRYEFVTPSLVP